jgi:sec-independent protein translocase protein TatC
MAEDGLIRMGILEHIEELRERLKWSFLTIIILFVFFSGFQARVANVGGASIPYPYPDPLRPFASQFFNLALDYLKPPGVSSSVLGPAEAIVVQFKTALFLSLLVGMPMISYQMGMFIGPALRPREKQTILRLLVPSMALFAAGVLVAFFVVLPFTFRFLYDIAANMGVDFLQLHIDEFMDFSLLFMLGFGLAFQVPVVMYGLTAVGLVRAAMWRKYWRLAIIGIFVFGVVITPDGSGVTMLLISVPMSFLYLAGYVAAVFHERRRARKPQAAA